MTFLHVFARSVPPRLFAMLIAGFSAACLGAALTAQFGFGLKPCELCLIQRFPFALNILIGILGTVWVARSRLMIAAAGAVFLVDSGIAFYHSGVERHWWTSFTGCSTPDMSGSIEEVMARIQATNVTRCDEIPWEMFGLSIANYNVLFCLILAVLCLFYLFSTKQRK